METKRSKHQKFNITEIPRSKIRLAEYNPRKISKEAETGLKKNLKEKGLLTPIVWNKRTGNLVSGHQRLKILDSLEKGQEYTLQVAQVDLSEKEEKEQNLFFNNHLVQGEWDSAKLEHLINNDQIDYNLAGFDVSTLNMLDVEVKLNHLFEGSQPLDELVNDIKTAYAPEKKQLTQEQIEEGKKLKREAKERTIKKDVVEFYIHIICEDDEAKEKFKEELGLIEDFTTPETLKEAFRRYFQENG